MNQDPPTGSTPGALGAREPRGSGHAGSEAETTELGRQLAECLAERDAAWQELELFAHTVSHDLRAPLRTVEGCASLLLEDGADHLTADDVELLERMREATAKAAATIESLLAYSRCTRVDTPAEVVEIDAVVGDILRALREREPDRQVEVVVAPGLRAVADPCQLRTALEHLIHNAWAFTRRTERPRIEVGAAERSGEPWFYVRDNGIGFRPADRSRLFVPYQRLHGDPKLEGAGVGLAIVRRIVRHQGGQVDAEGAPGQGATVWFRLPRA